ncbi:Conjugal transfer protein TrbG/VirB9/CagX [Leptothrix cholodnii SP-6]|uniref:Conjugal transfer protein TrbG/VirB9/CagX n=1 Tax=Leptothrix cholodnii (strain ATCC 51168 / LMG 8142 / SP-6) TaxID=395495 RepID=B1Y1V7_LEPCP|nr:TrbG/VirB9 family P-type conjugative transfer protein [Leptothrix cholodnii]ACB33137.1 Conjugal transfer protein TrbG/VirB9/CagX [Leptothrix cholodnii SP-6]
MRQRLHPGSWWVGVAWAFALLAALSASASDAQATEPAPSDPRLREVIYDPQAVVTVPVRRGVVTHVQLDADEAITEVAAGLGGDCTRPESAWCVVAQAGGRSFFVKARSSASAPNNLAVLTTRRTHAFEFVVLGPGDARAPVYRLSVKAAPPPRPSVAEIPALPALPDLPPLPAPEELVLARLQAQPQVRNTDYTLAEGEHAQDIVPTLVFDDGRFTYLKFPGQREVPAAFQVLGDGSEALVNTRMEGDLMVIDRVARRFVLRAGSAVVGLWNEGFDLDSPSSGSGTTVPGVSRALKAEGTPNRSNRKRGGTGHD